MKISLKNAFSSTAVLLIFFIIIQNVRKCHGQPMVTIGNTRIEGADMITRNHRNISGFMGIPYAEPPIGKLRFSNPVLKMLTKKYLLANKTGSACTQISKSGEKKVIGVEDCLFLNIYTPRKSFGEDEESLLPVMVLIHGSAFLFGSSEKLGPGYLLDKDIIYVSMNYRLNIFGFLSTGDEVVLGNFGIKDQVVALQWIQKYILYFGGDPKRVTLVGYSTGADSVNHHFFTNITEDYFQRYIMQSGCPFSVRSYKNAKRSAKIAKSVAAHFNCPTKNSQLLVNCLRNIDYKKLVNNTAIFHKVGHIFQSTWSPTIEPKVPGAYITENPFDIVKEKRIRDLSGISGIVRDEGLSWIAPFYVDDELYTEITENFDQFLTDVITYFEFTNDISTMVSEVKQFYFKNKVDNRKTVILRQLSDFVGDLFKIYPVTFAADFYAQDARLPLYFYLFNYRGSISYTNDATRNNWNIGIDHLDDLLYLYPHKPTVPVSYNEEILKRDSIMIDLMVDLWTSFVINGKPTSGKLCEGPNSWTPHKFDSNILVIGNYSGTKTKMVHSVLKERMEFWKNMQPLLLDNFLLEDDNDDTS